MPVPRINLLFSRLTGRQPSVQISYMPVDAFTIASNNYLGMARVFAESYLEHHPGARVYTCLVDRPSESIRYEDLPFEVILAGDLEIPNFSAFSFKYNILELNTAVKPFVYKYLRDEIGIDRAFYFDPDILIHDRLTGLEEALDRHLAVLTPHLTQPTDNRCRPPERVIGMCGIYNLGFLGLRLDPRTNDFLDWWCDRLDRYCFVDLPNGMFVDQSWMDFAPAYLESVAIMRDPIYNIAYWNLPHRFPIQVENHWQIDGRRVGFFHFSGVDLENIGDISRHQDRIGLDSRPELRPLFEGYRDLTRNSGQGDFQRVRYAFSLFSETTVPIPAVARRAVQEVDPCAARWKDPFDVSGDDSFLTWMAAPVELANGRLNRAAAYLWKSHEILQTAFPRVEDEDLPAFVDWFVAHGAEQYGFHEVFVRPLRHSLAATTVHEWRRIRGISMSDPGPSAEWLNEPVDEVSEPVMTRLAMAIHSARLDVQEEFPDPLGADRRAYAYWFERFGAGDYRLHQELVAPVLRGLPLKSRCASWVRRVLRLSKPAGGMLPSFDLSEFRQKRVSPAIQLEDGREISSQPIVGVNVLGWFEGVGGAGSFASDICEALETAGILHARVPVDHDLPDLMTTDRIRFECGTPYPATVLVVPSKQWHAFAEKLPIGCRVGGRLIGYSCDPAGALRATDMTCVDEVWVPTNAEALRVVKVSPVPVRPVLPPVSMGNWRAAPIEFELSPDRVWFLVVDHGTGEDDGLAISRAVECVRRLDRQFPGQMGLVLLVGSDCSSLASQLGRLPITVHRGPITWEVVRGYVRACDVVLDLRRFPAVGPPALEAVASGKELIIGSWEEIADTVGRDGAARINRIMGCDDSATAIVNALAVMAGIVRSGPQRPSRSTAEPGSGIRQRWQTEAADQWEREIRRVLAAES